MENISNINILIQWKHELNELLLDELTPSIFNHLIYYYNTAKNCSNDTTVLTTFQKFLRSIKNYKLKNDKLFDIDDEEKRIKIFKLTKALLKINYIILFDNTITKTRPKLEFVKFIKEIYIECARRFWSQCFLFYDKIPSVELKRNHLLILNIIKECILNTIRKQLLEHININEFLDNFLEQGDNYTDNYTDLLDFKTSSLLSVVQKVYKTDNSIQIGGNDEMLEQKNKILNIIDNNLKISDSQMPSININEPNTNDTYKKSSKHSTHRYSNEDKSNILSSRNESRYSSYNKVSKNPTDRYSEKKSSDTLKQIINNSFKDNHNSIQNTNKLNIDSNIKNKIMKDLESDTMTYHAEDKNEKYQDIFSNSEIFEKNKKTSLKINSNKQKFFNEYLKTNKN
jgi:hypothetical protein